MADSQTWQDGIEWGKDGLVPVIVQEIESNDVLMFAFMNRAALDETIALGEAVFWSRSRQRLWHKGEESGHVQKVREIRLDCDGDAILLKVEQVAAIACHTGRHSCFYQVLDRPPSEDPHWVAVDPVLQDPSTIYKKK